MDTVGMLTTGKDACREPVTLDTVICELAATAALTANSFWERRFSR